MQGAACFFAAPAAQRDFANQFLRQTEVERVGAVGDQRSALGAWLGRVVFRRSSAEGLFSAQKQTRRDGAQWLRGRVSCGVFHDLTYRMV